MSREKVTSAEDNQPLPGVSVVVKGTTTGTITNFDGEYMLANVPANATLVYSFIGMRSKGGAVNNQRTIDIVLESDVIGVDEVVVVGYGVQKKSLVTGAIAKVDGDQLRKATDMRVTQALQGKTAGVVIASNSGQPGDQISVRVRGTRHQRGLRALVHHRRIAHERCRHRFSQLGRHRVH